MSEIQCTSKCWFTGTFYELDGETIHAGLTDACGNTSEAWLNLKELPPNILVEFNPQYTKFEELQYEKFVFFIDLDKNCFEIIPLGILAFPRKFDRRDAHE